MTRAGAGEKGEKGQGVGGREKQRKKQEKLLVWRQMILKFVLEEEFTYQSDQKDTGPKEKIEKKGPYIQEDCYLQHMHEDYNKPVSAAQPALMFHHSMHVKATGSQAVHAITH